MTNMTAPAKAPVDTEIKTKPQALVAARVETGKFERLEDLETIVRIKDFNLYYGKHHALKQINLDIPKNRVTALIGPSGCGKSTLLRSINRMNDLIDNVRCTGSIFLGDDDIYARDQDVIALRKHCGMVFQKTNPFPKSIYENVIYPNRISGETNKKKLTEIVERCLKRVALWDEVHTRIHDNATALSGGQQQRLCIARGIASEPDVLLMDEPCSALDPIATAKIEELILDLRQSYTVVIVTHNMQQAARIADYTAFMYLGEIIEFGATSEMFLKPKLKQTEDYITGRFG